MSETEEYDVPVDGETPDPDNYVDPAAADEVDDTDDVDDDDAASDDPEEG